MDKTRAVNYTNCEAVPRLSSACLLDALNMCWCVDVLWMQQDEHVSQDNKSVAVAVATVVAAVDQARSRGPPDSAVPGEQVDPHHLLPPLHPLLKLSLCSSFETLYSVFTLFSNFSPFVPVNICS